MKFLDLPDGHVRLLPGEDRLPPAAHVFTAREAWALNTALATGRALLVRGEPGVGKSQLARAAAAELERGFVHQSVDALTGPHDLLWHFDAIGRLAAAQAHRPDDEVKAIRYVQPGALWWALDPAGARAQAETAGQGPCFVPDTAAAAHGVVALVDEIDKADPSVPNALLDALGHGRFDVHGVGAVSRTGAPLVLVTTNEERALPTAFLRRCVVLSLQLPTEGLVEHLVQRGRAHDAARGWTDAGVLVPAAEHVVAERARLKESGRYLPGLAEYLDLVRAVRELAPGKPKDQVGLLDRVREFVLDKQG